MSRWATQRGHSRIGRRGLKLLVVWGRDRHGVPTGFRRYAFVLSVFVLALALGAAIAGTALAAAGHAGAPKHAAPPRLRPRRPPRALSASTSCAPSRRATPSSHPTALPRRWR